METTKKTNITKGGKIVNAKQVLNMVQEMFRNSSLAELNKHTFPQASTIAFAVEQVLKDKKLKAKKNKLKTN